jgi:DNA-binding IclR family transcriptional regulator
MKLMSDLQAALVDALQGGVLYTSAEIARLVDLPLGTVQRSLAALVASNRMIRETKDMYRLADLNDLFIRAMGLTEDEVMARVLAHPHVQ